MIKRAFSILIILLCTLTVAAHYISTTSDAVTMYMDQEPPEDTVPTRLHIIIANVTNVSDFDMMHERLMHVFIVGQDLETFTHTHPDDYPDGLTNADTGIFIVNHTFPKAGTYAIAVDYSKNGVGNLKLITVEVVGDTNLSEPVLDFNHTKDFNGYTVSLSAPDDIVTGEEAQFVYTIMKDGKNVTDLQMYLGSEIHVFGISQDFSDAGHTHAYIPGHGLHYGTMPQHYKGPTIPVRYTFYNPGVYTLFGQFQHDGKVITTRFMVNVKGQAMAPLTYPQLEAVAQQKLNYAGIFVAAGIILFFIILIFFWYKHDAQKYLKR